ncbi:MAG: family 16 glycoside hydrolase [Gemmataceae bacterium]
MQLIVAVILLAMPPCLLTDPRQQKSIEGKATNLGKILFRDPFEKDTIGTIWRTNDKRRGVSGQSKIANGVLTVKRHPKADHGAVIDTLVEFTNAVIEFRFQLTGKTGFNLVIDDNQCKTVHAGHICRVVIRPGFILLQDDKTGAMNLKLRNGPLKTANKAQRANLLKGTTHRVPTKLERDRWYTLKVEMIGKTMSVVLDGKTVGKLTSPGIGHSPKRDFGFTVLNDPVRFDDVIVRDLVNPKSSAR